MAPSYFETVRSRADFRKFIQRRESPPNRQAHTNISSGSTWSTSDLVHYQVVCQGPHQVLPLLESFYDRRLQAPSELQPIGDQLAEAHPGPDRCPSETDVFHALKGHSMSVLWGALLRFDSTAISSSHHRIRSDGDEGMRQIGPSSSPPHSAPSGHSTISHKRNASVLSSSSSSSSSASPPGAGVTRPQQDTGSSPSLPAMSSSPPTSHPRQDTENSPSLPTIRPSPPTSRLPIRASPSTSRQRKRIKNPDYVDSTTLQIGSSSPAPTSQTSTSQSEYVDRNTHMEAARGASEDQTVHLLQSFIRSSLHFLQPRQKRLEFHFQELVEVDLIKVAHRCDIPSGPRLSAIDDGGLRLQQRDKDDQGWTTIQKRVALFEAKRKFVFDDDGRHIISDDQLGQMLAEALTARLAMAKNDEHMPSRKEE